MQPIPSGTPPLPLPLPLLGSYFMVGYAADAGRFFIYVALLNMFQVSAFVPDAIHVMRRCGRKHRHDRAVGPCAAADARHRYCGAARRLPWHAALPANKPLCPCLLPLCS